MKNYLRKIVVSGETYLWYRKHEHFDTSPGCTEVLTVFSQASRKIPLRIRFRGADNATRQAAAGTWGVGYPESGVLWFRQPNGDCGVKVNLNRPQVVAYFIRLMRGTQWRPTETRTPLVIENGLALLDEHHQTLQETIGCCPRRF